MNSFPRLLGFILLLSAIFIPACMGIFR
jgi:hypothetical protein